VLIGSVAGGFVTCSVLRCEPDGQPLIANAGHLPPWRNGAELPIDDPGLPLGVVPGLDWPDTSFHLAPGDQLTLLSDGVVEACNTQGELLGFARTASLTTQTAAEIASTARDWGQNDDITAVTIRRTALASTAIA
jgi:serine phosphatase RsbU (regulator of sigma subunit)